MVVKQLLKLLLVEIGSYRCWDSIKSIAQSSIKSSLESHVENTAIQCYNYDLSEKEGMSKGFLVDEMFSEIYPYLEDSYDIGVGVYVWNRNLSFLLVDKIREEGFQNQIICGGPEVSFEKNMDSGNIDLFVRGYAELPLIDYYQGEDIDSIEGICTEENFGNTSFSEIDEEMLSSYILPDALKKEKLRYETKRGCFGNCAYCQHSGGVNKIIEFPMERIREEIKIISQSTYVKSISVLDPIFNTGENYLRVMESFIEEGFNGDIAFQCRLELITDEFIELLEIMVENGIEPKIESGIQTIHKNESDALSRANDLGKCEENMDKLRNKELFTKLDLMYGLPNQTPSSFAQSVEYVQNILRPTKICAWPLLLLNGSDLYKRKDELGLVMDSQNRVIQAPSYSNDDYEIMNSLAQSVHFQEYEK